MQVTQIFQECRRRGLQMVPQGDKLLVSPRSLITDELRAAIRANKPDILAALAHEDATEYVAERSAICALDGLPPAHLSPVFEYHLADAPHARLIMLGYHGETLDEARASLFDRFGSKVLSIEPYIWPSRPPCGGLH